MGLILWIDKNSFAASLVGKVFKKKGLEFYYLENGNDFAYLVEDLRPEFIVIDPDTIFSCLENFKKQYQENEVIQQTKFVALGSWEGLDFIQKKTGQMERTIDPFTVSDKLQSFA